MPTKPKKPCPHPLCAELTDGGPCAAHVSSATEQYDRDRGSAAARGYDARWRKIRAMVLRERPLCQDCEAEGRVTPAREVDHVDGDVRHMARSNLRSLCKSCHSKKTARENGSFGRPRNV